MVINRLKVVKSQRSIFNELENITKYYRYTWPKCVVSSNEVYLSLQINKIEVSVCMSGLILETTKPILTGFSQTGRILEPNIIHLLRKNNPYWV